MREEPRGGREAGSLRTSPRSPGLPGAGVAQTPAIVPTGPEQGTCLQAMA